MTVVAVRLVLDNGIRAFVDDSQLLAGSHLNCERQAERLLTY